MKLVHAHVCQQCGGAFRRELFDICAITSGLYPCPKCGAESRLNLKVLDATKVLLAHRKLSTLEQSTGERQVPLNGLPEAAEFQPGRLDELINEA